MILSEHSVAQLSPDSNTLWTPQSLDTTGNATQWASGSLVASTVPTQAGISNFFAAPQKSAGERR